MLKKKVRVLLAVFLFLMALLTMQLNTGSAATDIFFEDFDTGYAGWSSSGNVATDNSPAIGANSVRLKKDGMVWRTISTIGYTDMNVTWTMAAQALESGEYCYAEINTGSGWTVIASLTNGDDDGIFRTGTVSLGADAGNNSNFQLRYRVTGNALGDYCYGEDTAVNGTVASPPTATATPNTGPTPTPTATPAPGSGVPGDPLTGPGNASRTSLTYGDLMSSSSPSAPVNSNAYVLPANAAPPNHTFSGRLELHNEATSGDWSVIRDDFNYDLASERQHLPEFDFEFVQNGSHLIPAQRGLLNTSHPYWNYIISPGRVWQETNDGGYTRASLPFALVERNANCTHNGLMTFLFDNAGNVSNVRYQLTQETCLYFKYDMWGQLSATYHAGIVPNSTSISDNYVQEVTNLFPTKPFSDLAVDYPGIDLAPFTNSITPQHMSTYGVVFNGTNYVGDCDTRYGSYPFCPWMRLPSYSTAKSAFASVAHMRLAQKYGVGVEDTLIKDYVPEYSSSSGDWTNVTIGHALDMATGNYRFSQYMRDEGLPQMTNFFDAESDAGKMNEAFSFPSKTAPGNTWVYHTSDTFIATRAMQNYLQTQEGTGADIFQMVIDEIFMPLNIGPGAYTTLRTSDNNWTGQPFGGYGLWWTQDDIAKITTLLNVNAGISGGTQLLQPDLLADVMQHDPTNRGLDTATQPFKYNNGFWAKEFTTADGYACNFWVPFMSGYGGITVAMTPSGATYYYFSDNDEFGWAAAVQQLHNHVADNCS